MPYRLDLPVPLNEQRADQDLFESQGDTAPVPLPSANSTRSFWLHPSSEVDPLAKEGSKGPIKVTTSDDVNADDDANVDICIIGSGITGVSAAYHLSKSCPEKKVAILEARDFCSGATGRNGGHLTPNPFFDFVSYSKSIGIEEAKKQFKLERHTVQAVVKLVRDNGLEDIVDFVAGGHVELLFTGKEADDIRADYELARSSGLDVSDVAFLSKEETSEKYGAAYPAVRGPGHNLWPLKLVTQLFYLAKSAFSSSSGSLSLFTSAPVSSVIPINSTGGNSSLKHLWRLSTPRGSISCTVVLHATNAYASHLIPSLAGPQGIVPVRGQIIATRASVPLSNEDRASWDANEHYEYWFPRPPKAKGDVERPLIILGGGREGTENHEIGISDDSILNTTVGQALRKFLPSVFPEKFKDGNEPEWEWTGIMGFTSSRDPFVGPIFDSDGSELKGQYIAAGFSGHGMSRTFGCAEAIVSLINHDLTGLPRKNWSVPEWLPKSYLMWNRK